MSLNSAYRNWYCQPSWSGSLGVGPINGVICSYSLAGQGLIIDDNPGIRHTAHQGVMATVRERPGNSFRYQDPDASAYTASFTGAGSGHGPLPAGWSVSAPVCPARGSRVLYVNNDALQANDFQGAGVIVDGSLAAGHGLGFQLLFFNVPRVTLASLFSLDEIAAIVQRGEIASLLRANIPIVSASLGYQFGVSIGVTMYEGVWHIAQSSQEVLYTPGFTGEGPELPPERRPVMGSGRAVFNRRR